MAYPKIEIETLHVRSERPSAGLRLRLSSLLGASELQPSCLPPSAVLIVRRLTDPLPGRLGRKSAARIDGAWERAARNRLAELYAQAARPSQGPVPANAEAVRFGDEAEMLACLVLDLSRGEARQRWWWQTPLRGLPDAASAGMTTLLCRQATQTPAVLHQLSQRGHAVAVLQSLSPGQAMAILVATSRACDLPELHLGQPPADTTVAAWPPAASARQAAGEEEGPPPADPGTLPSAAFALPPSPEAPWRDWLPAGPALSGLTPEQAVLLGVGLGLYRAPAIVRSADFVRKLREWWLATVAPAGQPKPFRQTAHPPSGQPAPLSPQPATPPRHSTQQPVEEAPPATLARQSTLPAKPSPSVQAVAGVQPGAAEHKPQPQQIPDRPVDDAGQPQPGEPATDPASTTGETRPTPALPPQTDELPPVARTEIPVARAEPELTLVTANDPPQPLAQVTEPPSVRIQTGSPAAEPQQPDERLATAWRLANGVTTRLSGVWYLINLMAFLDLPDCFEEEWHLATRLGAWGTLEALARALLANSDSALAEDPLWLALAELGGRGPGETLGADLPENADFRLPVAWLARSDSGDPACAWADDGQRLCLWSEDGYLLVDVARDPLEPSAPAAAELRRYRGDVPLQRDRQQDVGVRTSPQPTAYREDAPLPPHRQRFDDAPLASLDGPLMAGLSPPLRRWLERVMPYLRWRLRRALTDAADAAGQWLCQPGQLYVTSTHVDLVMSLDAVSVPIRLAGLDRDPGWLPEFGRVIKFYFE